MIMTDKQKFRYDLLKECGFDFDKAQRAFEWIMDNTAQKKETDTGNYGKVVVIDNPEGAPEYPKRIQANGRRLNLVNADDEFLSDTWFDEICDFSEGFARVRLNNMWNLVNTEGELLSEEWFENAWDFHGGLALVKMDGKCNFINDKSKYLSDTWFDDAGFFIDGRAIVELNGERFCINKQGKRIQ